MHLYRGNRRSGSISSSCLRRRRDNNTACSNNDNINDSNTPLQEKNQTPAAAGADYRDPLPPNAVFEPSMQTNPRIVVKVTLNLKTSGCKSNLSMKKVKGRSRFYPYTLAIGATNRIVAVGRIMLWPCKACWGMALDFQASSLMCDQ